MIGHDAPTDQFIKVLIVMIKILSNDVRNVRLFEPSFFGVLVEKLIVFLIEPFVSKFANGASTRDAGSIPHVGDAASVQDLWSAGTVSVDRELTLLAPLFQSNDGNRVEES